MAQASLKPLKAILETIREQADFALKQLQESEEERSMRWKCKDCWYVKRFTRPVSLEAAGRCSRCKSISFQCLAWSGQSAIIKLPSAAYGDEKEQLRDSKDRKESWDLPLLCASFTHNAPISAKLSRDPRSTPSPNRPERNLQCRRV